MGYRSEVAVLIYPDEDAQNEARYDTLKLLMNTTFKGVYEEFEANFTWRDSHRVLQFEAQGVKWYDSYSDVQHFHSMLDAIGEMEGFNYEFTRVGEDAEDIEQVQRGDDVQHHVGVKRSIEVNL